MIDPNSNYNWYYSPKLITHEVQAIKTHTNTFRLTWKEDLGKDVSDDEIAYYLNMGTTELREFLANNFQGMQFIKHYRTYFKNRKTAKLAAEWINSIMLVNKLVEE